MRRLVIDGGYIVFDEFADNISLSPSLSATTTSRTENAQQTVVSESYALPFSMSDVRRAVLAMIRDGKTPGFDVVGNVGNEVGAGPYPNSEAMLQHSFADWPRSMGKSFILWKGDSHARDSTKMREYERIMRSNDALKSRLTTLDLRRKDQPLKLKGFGRLFSKQKEPSQD
ncbi:Hypothetical protein, putative [Bodo saltans]|uniref:Uncharacterized protein n=1 Tax=Bodo saltans TaxID=75058 RepID=A0A0S4JSM8_BODSA|nr:Hypothetical protein, putative [Bodo saltans]|eukprot:CUG93368.1 Hypothetical protein, putative [Bodo saltans]